jgi:thioredoxin reductase
MDEVLVVGAGPVGLTVGIELLREGAYGATAGMATSCDLMATSASACHP